MGRARGTKRDRGTGEPTPGRGAWPPELRDLQRRGGMSPDWHEATHGRGSGTGKVATDPFPLVHRGDILSMQREPWSAARRYELLRRANIQGRLLPGNPLVRALFENEWMRLEAMLDYISHEKLEIDKEALWQEWEEAVCVSFQEAGRMNDPARIRTSLLGFMIQPDTSLTEETREAIVQSVMRMHARFPSLYAWPYLREEVMGAIRDFPWNSPLLLPEAIDEKLHFLEACQKAWAPGTVLHPFLKHTLATIEEAGMPLDEEETLEFRRSFLAELSRLAYPPAEEDDFEEYYNSSEKQQESVDRVEEAMTRALCNSLRSTIHRLRQEELEIGSEDLVAGFFQRILGPEDWKRCRSRYISMDGIHQTIHTWGSDTSDWKKIISGKSTLRETILEKLSST